MIISDEWSSISVMNKKDNIEASFILRIDCTKELEKAGELQVKESFEEMVFELRRAIDDRFGLIKKQ